MPYQLRCLAAWLARILAIVNPDNTGSIRLLERLGFALEGTTTLKGETRELKLFGSSAP